VMSAVILVLLRQCLFGFDRIFTPRNRVTIRVARSRRGSSRVQSISRLVDIYGNTIGLIVTDMIASFKKGV
jgi:hypothetical protein